jgi:hypothetical protein
VLRLSALFEAARPWAQHRPRHLDSPVSATGAQAGSVSTPSERTFAQKDAATMTHWAFVTGGGGDIGGAFARDGLGIACVDLSRECAEGFSDGSVMEGIARVEERQGRGRNSPDPIFFP